MSAYFRSALLCNWHYWVRAPAYSSIVVSITPFWTFNAFFTLFNFFCMFCHYSIEHSQVTGFNLQHWHVTVQLPAFLATDFSSYRLQLFSSVVQYTVALWYFRQFISRFCVSSDSQFIIYKLLYFHHRGYLCAKSSSYENNWRRGLLIWSLDHCFLRHSCC